MTKAAPKWPECILLDDAPELTDEAMDRATYKIGGKVVSREEWRIAAKAFPAKGRYTELVASIDRRLDNIERVLAKLATDRRSKSRGENKK